MLDMGPYYITALVNLLGPVHRVAGITSRARRERLVTSEPLAGTRIPVEVATHVAGTLEFVSGPVVTIAMSDHGARPMMGGLCFNDWLIQEGYLVLKDTPTGVTPIADAPIDWS